MRRIDFQPAYILHSRPYQESSLLLELFTQDFGRFAVIAKGVRRQKNHTRALLQAFVPLLISCSGRGELLVLKNYESKARLHLLFGKQLISALYVNELLMRLLHRFDAHETLFQVYANTLVALELSVTEETGNNTVSEENAILGDKTSFEGSSISEDNGLFTMNIILRLFEKALLKAIGYELPLTREVNTGQPIDPDAFYNFDPERGPIAVESPIKQGRPVLHSATPATPTPRTIEYPTEPPKEVKKYTLRGGVYSGRSIIALSQEKIAGPKIQREIKHLMRQALQYRLGDKPLETRRLVHIG